MQGNMDPGSTATNSCKATGQIQTKHQHDASSRIPIHKSCSNMHQEKTLSSVSLRKNLPRSIYYTSSRIPIDRCCWKMHQEKITFVCDFTDTSGSNVSHFSLSLMIINEAHCDSSKARCSLHLCMNPYNSLLQRAILCPKRYLR